jgi:hypothetical protein
MDSPEAIQSVNGTCTIRRWTGSEVMHRSMFELPAIVGAYNSFVNAVDRMDQICSSYPTRRREKRVSMTLLTLILDLPIINAQAIYKKLQFGTEFTLTCFKQGLCEQLVTPLVRLKQNETVTPDIPYQRPNIDEVVGSLDSNHYLMNLKRNVAGRPADAHCYLCLLFRKKLKTRFGCVQCKKAFHSQCFTAFHFQHALTHNKRVMIERAINGVDNIRGGNKKCNHMGNLREMDYPFERET